MSGGQRWPHVQAMAVAEALADELRTACERIEIAGSLRRKKPGVGDIELLCVPKVEPDMFGCAVGADLLDLRLQALIKGGTLGKRPNVKGRYTYGPKNKLLRHIPSGIPLDVFSTEARNWGMAMFIRTGSAEWNIRAMARFQQRGMQGHAYGGVTLAGNIEADCPEEADVFKHLGWEWVEPEARS
jgi:DNA polymerase (family 10)